VTGETRYVADVVMPDMLHAQVLRSPHPHARLLKVDTQTAQALPGVRGVFTARDIPGMRSFPDNLDLKDGLTDLPTHRVREPVLAFDRVRMVGEPIAIVVANTQAAARAGVDAIRITYEVLEPVFDPDRALSADAQRLHSHGNEYEVERISKGDAGTAMEMAHVCIESTCRLSSHDHLALEPTSAVAYVDEGDTLTVLGPTQQPHLRRVQIAEMLAISPQRVRVIVPEMGGSFGGRHHFWPVLAIALPAYLLRQPVRLVFTRREDLQATLKRHPFEFHCQVGARRDGTLLSLRARGTGNAGPYGGAPGIAALVAQSGVGPYRWPAIDYECRIGHTNWANAGAFRGYGMPQGAFALETSLDELATALGMDPLELRLLNAIDNETGSALGHRFDEPFAFREVLTALRPEWQDMRQSRRTLRRGGRSTDLFGVGLATSWYQFSKVGALRMSAQAGLDLDGRITLYYTALRSGQGLDTVMSQIASHELGVPRSAVVLVNADTDLTPHGDAYGGCRSTYWVGGAVQQAARALKGAILDAASGMLDISADQLAIAERTVHVAGARSPAVALSDIAANWRSTGRPLRYTGSLDLTHRLADTGGANILGHFVVGAAAAQVRVDARNGRVDVLCVTVAQDVGRAINPTDLEGQIQGAVLMELGATLMEEYVPGETLDLKGYRIPRMRDAPEIKVLMLETGGRDGPFGAKGVGEAVMGHTRAAIANAIHDAAGIRIRHLPATPGRVLEALDRLQSTSVGGR
jgi:CO/xanthine dehydrogenase Mo-binding subunit